MEINWQHKSFNELTPDELYAILRLRSEVFIVEQQCIYLDPDNRDQSSIHLMGRTPQGELAAYLRILPRGVESDDYGSIGRVVVPAHLRSCGLGRELFAHGLELYNMAVGGDVPLRIHAQAQLQRFYGHYGFTPMGEVHEFEGRPHIFMQRAAKA